MRRLLAVMAVLVIVAAVAVVAAPGLVPGLSPGPTSGPTSTLVPSVPVDESVLAEARAVPVRNAAIGVSAPGTVLEVRVAPGASVAQGDPLVVLDPAAVDAELAGAAAAMTGAMARAAQATAGADQALSAVAVATANVTAALAGVAAAEAARDLLPEDAEAARTRAATADVDRARAGLSAARSQLSGARAGLTVARRAVDIADADVERAGAAIRGLEVARAQLTIAAPFAGTVAWLAVTVGDRVVPGAILLRLADTSEWRFETTDLGQDGAARLRMGDGARITFDALPGTQIAGRVAMIGGFGVDRQGDVVVPVTIAPDEAVPAGIVWNMTVTVSIQPSP